MAAPARTIAVGLSVVLGLIALPGSAVAAPALGSSSSSPVARGDLAADFVGQINAARTAAGRPRLLGSGSLSAVAWDWAMSMARSNVLAHNPGLASAVRGWRYLGENVGVGFTVDSLEGAFWSSPTHRSNILDRDYTRIGLAVVDVGGKLWVVEDFSRPYSDRTVRPVNQPAARSGPQARDTRRSSARGSTAGLAPRRTAGSGRVATARPAPPVSLLAGQCAVQARRLFAARHHLKHGLDGALIRRDLPQ